MNRLLYRYKYSLLSCCLIALTVFLIGFFIFPKMLVASDILVSIRSEVKDAGGLVENSKSPDSLIAEYGRISSELDSYVNVPVSSSKILTFILEAAKDYGVTLQDLSTGEIVSRGENLEYPVKFKSSAGFNSFLRFMTSLENGIYCVKVVDVDMDSKSASVRLSVLSKVVRDE